MSYVQVPVALQAKLVAIINAQLLAHPERHCAARRAAALRLRLARMGNAQTALIQCVRVSVVQPDKLALMGNAQTVLIQCVRVFAVQPDRLAAITNARLHSHAYLDRQCAAR